MAKLPRSFSKEEDIPQNFREAYIEKDGKWILDAEDEDGEKSGSRAEIKKLAQSLEQEKEQRRNAVKKLEEIQAKYKDIDPEKALEAQKKLEELEEEKLRAEKRFEELAERKYSPALKLKDEALAELNKLYAAEKEARTKSDQALTRHKIDGVLRDSMLAAGVKPEAATYLLSLTREPWQLDEDGETPVLMKDGRRESSPKDPARILSAEEYYQLLPSTDKVLANFYKESTGSGASNGGRMSNGAIVLSREEARDHATYKAASERALKAGVSLEVK